MKLLPFVDALPIPKVLQPKEQYRSHKYYEVRMKEIFHKFHRDLPPTKVWGYEGQLPGPTIEAEKDQTVYVKWINDLPEKHLLLSDRFISIQIISGQLPFGITTMHWASLD